MTNIREAMPLLARHEGVWYGVYSYFNDQNEKTDEHKSRLICRFPDDGPYPYHQTNHYLWDDGRTEIREFPAEYRDGRVWWYNDLIQGWAAEVPLDEFNRTVMLYWQRSMNGWVCSIRNPIANALCSIRMFFSERSA